MLRRGFCNSNVFYNHTWLSAQWRDLYAKILEINLFTVDCLRSWKLIYLHLFTDCFIKIVGTNIQQCSDD